MDTPTVGHKPGTSRRGLDTAALGERLRGIGFTPFFTDATGSTNTDLVEAVWAEGERGSREVTGAKSLNFYNQTGEVPHLSVLLAEEQLAGRGRMGRRWTAPRHSQVIASVVLRLNGIPADSVGLLPLLTGMAIAQGVRTASESAGRELSAELKWPNDVLICGRKLAGILVEAAKVDMGEANGGQRGPLLKEAVVVLGFGVNYDLAADELPVAHATSIALEAEQLAKNHATDQLIDQRVSNQRSSSGRVSSEGTPSSAAGLEVAIPGREAVIFHILENLERDVARFRQLGGAPEAIMGRYRQLSATIGTRVKAFLPGDEFVTGMAVDVDTSGELVIQVETHEGKRAIAPGQRLTVAAGDVEHLRSADISRHSEWGYA
ncbi:biotin--[acetyl-CoA-carboxylase] ligase [Corynebacterium resistens]|nr:biotin--[acetyl-CoA-carboxylase] ligase [Corynebacterium resistens]